MSMPAALLADALPPLPPYIYGRETSANERVFTADQMRAYALEALRTQAAALAEREWIAVSERLPEPDSGEVLVWLTGGRCAIDEWIGGPTTPMGVMWRDYEFEDITHWMPLPAPPLAAAPSPIKEQTK